ncbi:MAG: hypothetical protein AAF399_19395 [Bacteroidota bacterium]
MLHMLGSRFSCWLLLGAALVLVINSGFEGATPTGKDKSFQVAPVGKPIAKDKKTTLLAFYRAIYGSKAQPSSIEIVKDKKQRKAWLAFQGGDQDSPTMAIELQVEKGAYTFGISSAKNTCKGNPCSHCRWKWGYCACIGDGESCNHIGTGLKSVGSKPLAVVGLAG